VNKMDEKTVQWSKARYDQIVDTLNPFLKKWGYNIKRDVSFIPVSGFTGANLKDVNRVLCPWYEGPSFMDLLDEMRPMERADLAPLRIPVLAKYKERGVVCILGKVESGVLVIDENLILMPNGQMVTCTGILVEDAQVNIASPGENIVVQVKGVEEEDIAIGSVVSYPTHPTKKTRCFEAQLAVLDLLPHKPLITAGYSCVFHCHTIVCECQISKLLAETDKSGKAMRVPRYIKSNGQCSVRILLDETVAVETFKDFPQLGRFTLRDEGMTIAVGKILSIVERTRDADRADRAAEAAKAD